jgi:hypothetical protein
MALSLIDRSRRWFDTSPAFLPRLGLGLAATSTNEHTPDRMATALPSAGTCQKLADCLADVESLGLKKSYVTVTGDVLKAFIALTVCTWVLSRQR